MKRFILLIFLFAFTTSCFAQTAGTTIKGRKANGTFDWIKIADDGSLVIGGVTFPPVTVTIATISAELATGPNDIGSVYESRLKVASSTVGSFTTVAYTIPLISGVRELSIQLTGTDKEAWVLLGGDAPTVGNGIKFQNSIEITKLNSSEIIKVIASETIGACWVQR